MVSLRSIAKSAAFLAVVGMQIPTVSAGQIPTPQSESFQIQDIALTSNNLSGQLLSPSGNPLGDAHVEVRAAGKRVALGKTQPDGTFVVTGMGTGMYEIVTADGPHLIRTWNSESAPPNAKQALILTQGDVVRSQDINRLPYLELGILGGVITGIAVGVAQAKDSNIPASP